MVVVRFQVPAIGWKATKFQCRRVGWRSFLQHGADFRLENNHADADLVRADAADFHGFAKQITADGGEKSGDR